MLFTNEEILAEFEERLGEAVRVHIATAWAASGPQLDALKDAVQKKGLEVRAIVGTHGNATEPSALELLDELGQLRLAGNEVLFHPKVYVFECRNGASCAWIGSANFTRPGFGGGNVEAVYETDEVDKVEPILEWFEQRWKQSKPASQEAIYNYRQRYERDPPARVLAEVVGKQEGDWEGDLEPVLDPDEISRAFGQMRETLIAGEGFVIRKVRRTPDMKVYWHARHKYWCAFKDPAKLKKRHYWNCFGREDPGKSDRTLNPDLEINPPLDGNNKRPAGLFVRNDRRDVFLARDLNKVNNVKANDFRKMVEKEFPKNIVGVRWKKRTRCMIVLGEVNSRELRGRVAKLVGLVAELRSQN